MERSISGALWYTEYLSAKSNYRPTRAKLTGTTDFDVREVYCTSGIVSLGDEWKYIRCILWPICLHTGARLSTSRFLVKFSMILGSIHFHVSHKNVLFYIFSFFFSRPLRYTRIKSSIIHRSVMTVTILLWWQKSDAVRLKIALSRTISHNHRVSVKFTDGWSG